MLKYLLKSAFWAIEKSYNTPERKGARGESQVHNALTSVLDEQDYRVLSDLILPIRSGTTQLDHLVLSRFGIFVIETKNMSGWIFGSFDQQKWTQVQKGGMRRRFQNPLRQNFAHVKAVQEVLDVDSKALHNFIVFTGTAEPKTEMPENVAWGLRALGRLIAARKQVVFSEQQLDVFARKLQNRALENNQSARREHVQNLQIKAAANTSKQALAPTLASADVLCPKCSRKMVKRSNKKTGDVFWGCETFPKCRGTRKAK